MIKKRVNIEDIKKAKAFLNEINTIDLASITFTDENDVAIKIPQQFIDEFRYTGLNNSDFILSEFYKTGFDNK